MRIEQSSQVWQSYSKPMNLSASKSFQQLIQAKSQESSVSTVSAQPPKTGETLETFSAAERRYGCVTVSNATHAKPTGAPGIMRIITRLPASLLERLL